MSGRATFNRPDLRRALALAACLFGAPAMAADERPEWLPEGSLGTGLPLLADPGGLRAALWERLTPGSMIRTAGPFASRLCYMYAARRFTTGRRLTRIECR